MGGGDQQGHVMFAAAIAHHADRHGDEGFKKAAQDLGGLCDLIAYDGNDGEVLFDADGPKGLELLYDRLEVGSRVDGNGNGHFGSGDHVDRGPVFLKDLEYLPQEAVSQQHAAALDVDGNDTVFGGDGL